MTKRKPSAVNSVRIELQTKERELLEQAILGQQVTSVIDSITSMKIETMYGLLNLLEAFGIVDTPIPTVTDVAEIPAAIASFATTMNEKRKEGKAPVEGFQEQYGTWGNLWQAIQYSFLPFSEDIQDKYRQS